VPGNVLVQLVDLGLQAIDGLVQVALVGAGASGGRLGREGREGGEGEMVVVEATKRSERAWLEHKGGTVHACAGPWKHLRNGREWKERSGVEGRDGMTKKRDPEHKEGTREDWSTKHTHS